MKHLVMLFFILSFSIGLATLLLSVFYFFKYKKNVIKLFIFFMLSLLLFHFSITLYHYNHQILAAPLPHISQLVALSELLGVLIHSLALPNFIHLLLGIPFQGFRKKIIISLVAVQTLLIVAFIFSPLKYLQISAQLIMFSIDLWSIVFVAKNFAQIGNATIRQVVITFFTLIVVFFPFILIDTFGGNVSFLPYNFTLPLYFFILNILCLVFAISFLNQPPYMLKGNLTQFFAESFNLTKRELEVIGLLLQGNTNKHISEELYISSKTLENHITNIYKKTSIKSRIQLSNLIHSNSNQ